VIAMACSFSDQNDSALKFHWPRKSKSRAGLIGDVHWHCCPIETDVHYIRPAIVRRVLR
jgi:hypothetical protein